MKKWNRISAACLAAIMTVGTILSVPTAYAEDSADTYRGVAITEHEGGYDYGFSKRTQVTHGYDFSLDRINHYATDTAIAMSNRANAEIIDGALTTKDGKDFVFGSAVGLGDDYGLEEGYLTFDLKLTGGTVYLGVRTSRVTLMEPIPCGSLSPNAAWKPPWPCLCLWQIRKKLHCMKVWIPSRSPAEIL